MELRIIEYERHEYFWNDEGPQMPVTRHTANLLTFIYDIPYFAACGICPPLHIMNEKLASGGGPGGMSPGASWQPFTISEEEFSSLAEAIINTDVQQIRSQCRYAFRSMKFDPAFDHIQDGIEWSKAVCNRHRESCQKNI